MAWEMAFGSSLSDCLTLFVAGAYGWDFKV